MHLIVTRPRDDAVRTAAELALCGHQAILAPLLEIEYRAGEPLALDGVQALLLTSANGVEALTRRSARRDIPVFAVGIQSANAARDAGFEKVFAAGGDAAALAGLVATSLHPEDGAIFYAAGAQTRGGIAARLERRGFIVRSETLYEAVAAMQLPEIAAEALRQGTAGGVLLYSPRSAEIFARLVTAAGLSCAGLTAFCISPATEAALGPLEFARVCVAAEPGQAGMLSLLR